METQGILGLISRIREQGNLLIEQELKARNLDGIVPAHGSVFHFLFQQNGPIPIKSIVERIGRVKSTVTGMIQTLERYGYIQKYPCISDNRVTYIELTKKGKNLQNDFDEISRIVVDRLYGTMPMKDRERLVEMLQTIELNLQP